ncbi:DUF3618 domain-containing protein [Streptomyces sp. NPDC048357]|uniref:DUF3618 domain-containing protein n=1 Tax=Streptomyces sp. NPDC048357 TaxID=3154719 RepID=UPI0034339748
MTDEPRTTRTDIGTPTPEKLREQVEHTRDELGQTIEALAAKADVKAQAKERTAALKEQAAEKTVLVTDQVTAVVRANRKPLLVAGVALLVLLLVRRSRLNR